MSRCPPHAFFEKKTTDPKPPQSTSTFFIFVNDFMRCRLSKPRSRKIQKENTSREEEGKVKVFFHKIIHENEESTCTLRWFGVGGLL